MKSPEWLQEFQAQWGQLLRTPLETSGGVFHSKSRSNWKAVYAMIPETANAGISVYHFQYWTRLFNVLQKEFPLTAELMGHWDFNLLAQRYLLEHPPCTYALQDLAEYFETFLDKVTLPGPPGCLRQAAAWDRARQKVFAAPFTQAWNPQGLAVDNLFELTLKPCADWMIISEDWPLLDLYLALLADRSKKLSWPDRLLNAQTYLVQRVGAALVYRPLVQLQSRFYQNLQKMNLGLALIELEKKAQGSEADLHEYVRRWLQEGVVWGLWLSPIAETHP